MWNITLNTFKEIVRNKFLYLIIFFAIIFLFFSIILWKLTMWEDSKVIVDFWLAMIELFWLIWVLFVGSQLLFKEVEWKTIFLILSKPIKRYEFLLWKFFWFSLTITLIILVQSIFFIFILLYKDIQITYLIVFSLFFIFLKLEILLSIVLFLATFMSNMLTILISLLIYFLSHSFQLIIDLWFRLKNEIVVDIARGIQLLFPPFEALNIKDIIGSFVTIKADFIIYNTFYAIMYIIILLYLTILIFNKKKFEN